MKRILFLTIASFICLSLSAQKKFTYGIYLGTGFASEKTDYSNISTLPIDHGGFSFHYGIHLNYAIAKRLQLETGLKKVTKGYEYTSTVNLSSQYNKITTASVPAVLLVHIIDYPEEIPFRLSIGAGLYASYAVSGKIINENGTKTNASFSNSNRFETGPRIMSKFEFFHKLEAYLATDIASTNTIKNGSGYVKQGSIQIGLGWVFK